MKFSLALVPALMAGTLATPAISRNRNQPLQGKPVLRRVLPGWPSEADLVEIREIQHSHGRKRGVRDTEPKGLERLKQAIEENQHGASHDLKEFIQEYLESDKEDSEDDEDGNKDEENDKEKTEEEKEAERRAEEKKKIAEQRLKEEEEALRRRQEKKKAEREKKEQEERQKESDALDVSEFEPTLDGIKKALGKGQKGAAMRKILQNYLNASTGDARKESSPDSKKASLKARRLPQREEKAVPVNNPSKQQPQKEEEEQEEPQSQQKPEDQQKPQDQQPPQEQAQQGQGQLPQQPWPQQQWPQPQYPSYGPPPEVHYHFNIDCSPDSDDEGCNCEESEENEPEKQDALDEAVDELEQPTVEANEAEEPKASQPRPEQSVVEEPEPEKATAGLPVLVEPKTGQPIVPLPEPEDVKTEEKPQPEPEQSKSENEAQELNTGDDAKAKEESKIEEQPRVEGEVGPEQQPQPEQPEPQKPTAGEQAKVEGDASIEGQIGTEEQPERQEQPKVQLPKISKPKVERQPTTDQPKEVGEPTVGKSKTKKQPSLEQPEVWNSPSADKPKIKEQPAPEQPEPEQPKSDEQLPEKLDVVTDAPKTDENENAQQKWSDCVAGCSQYWDTETIPALRRLFPFLNRKWREAVSSPDDEHTKPANGQQVEAAKNISGSAGESDTTAEKKQDDVAARDARSFTDSFNVPFYKKGNTDNEYDFDTERPRSRGPLQRGRPSPFSRQPGSLREKLRAGKPNFGSDEDRGFERPRASPRKLRGYGRPRTFPVQEFDFPRRQDGRLEEPRESRKNCGFGYPKKSPKTFESKEPECPPYRRGVHGLPVKRGDSRGPRFSSKEPNTFEDTFVVRPEDYRSERWEPKRREGMDREREPRRAVHGRGGHIPRKFQA